VPENKRGCQEVRKVIDSVPCSRKINRRGDFPVPCADPSSESKRQMRVDKQPVPENKLVIFLLFFIWSNLLANTRFLLLSVLASPALVPAGPHPSWNDAPAQVSQGKFTLFGVLAVAIMSQDTATLR